MSMSRRSGGAKADRSLDDVQVLGQWNFTLQGDTPLFWIKSGALDSYLLQFTVHMPSPAVAGLILHAEQDGSGSDGVSFWIDRSDPRGDKAKGQRRYMLAGDGLESKSIATRGFDDEGGQYEEFVEVLVQGYSGTILLQDRKLKLAFRARNGRGCLAFYNSTQGEDDEVHFSGVRITALRRGPLEISGTLGQREHTMLAPAEQEESQARSTSMQQSTTLGPTSMQDASSWQSTMTPGSSRALAQGGWSHSATKPAGARKGGLRPSASDGLLQGAGASAVGLRSTGTKPQKRKEETWAAFALNAPSGEQDLLRSTAGARKAPAPAACNDFIAM
jgi:hypothetical protein